MALRPSRNTGYRSGSSGWSVRSGRPGSAYTVVPGNPKARGRAYRCAGASHLKASGGWSNGCAGYAQARAHQGQDVGAAASLSDVGNIIAEAKGYFVEQGLDVENVPVKSSADVIASLGTGDLDVVGGGWTLSYANLLQRGVPFSSRRPSLKSEGFCGCAHLDTQRPLG